VTVGRHRPNAIHSDCTFIIPSAWPALSSLRRNFRHTKATRATPVAAHIEALAITLDLEPSALRSTRNRPRKAPHVRAVVFDVGETLIDETTEYGT